nr:MAG TPA: hypothetical protein [Caudoviricetes sp.]
MKFFVRLLFDKVAFSFSYIPFNPLDVNSELLGLYSLTIA